MAGLLQAVAAARAVEETEEAGDAAQEAREGKLRRGGEQPPPFPPPQGLDSPTVASPPKPRHSRKGGQSAVRRRPQPWPRPSSLDPEEVRLSSEDEVPSPEQSRKIALAALTATRVALMEKEARARAAKAERTAREAKVGAAAGAQVEAGAEVAVREAWNPTVLLNEFRRGQAEAPPSPKLGLGLGLGLGAVETEETRRFRAGRRRFVEEALRNIGADYDTIDCCGLVRLCVHALPDVFNGFRLDRCNQGVMLETLKHAMITDPRDLQLGDLIFYSADVSCVHRCSFVCSFARLFLCSSSCQPPQLSSPPKPG